MKKKTETKFYKLDRLEYWGNTKTLIDTEDDRNLPTCIDTKEWPPRWTEMLLNQHKHSRREGYIACKIIRLLATHIALPTIKAICT